MNVYLQRARSALAAGRPEEASVHAWNAVATVREEEDREELLRLASELNDELLLRELEDRRVRHAAQEQEPEPKRAVSKLAFLPFALVMVAMGVALLTQPFVAAPGLDEDQVRGRQEAHPRLATLTDGVWLVPVERAGRVDLHRIANELSSRYRIQVGVQSEQVSLTSSTVEKEDEDLVAERLLDLLARAYPAEGDVTVIGVTDYDMYSPTHGHTFTLRSETNYAIVSTAQLGASLLDRLRGHDRHERTRKLIARNIAFLHLRLPMVRDPKSLRRTTMSRPEDIDELEERF